MIGLLWSSSLVLSSRYHALVCSMAGGPVSVGVTMDERIRNLMADRGTPDLALEVDDPDLADRLEAALERTWTEQEAQRDGIARCVVRNLRTMGTMGQILVDHVRRRHPEMPFRPELGEAGDPWDHLPSLPTRIRHLVETYA
jgi:polysaccharide pyruvyl transferase WcaK-like protein